jgi:hypothetical protein
VCQTSYYLSLASGHCDVSCKKKYSPSESVVPAHGVEEVQRN